MKCKYCNLVYVFVVVTIQKNDKIGILLSNLEFLLLTCKQPQNGVHVKVEIALQRGPG